MKKNIKKLCWYSSRILFFFRNILGIILAFSLLLLYFMRNLVPNVLLNIVGALLIVYCVIAKIFDKYFPEILVEDISKFETYWYQNIDSKLGVKAPAYYYLGLSSYYKGEFEKAIAFLDKNVKVMQTKKARKQFRTLKQNSKLLAYIFLMYTKNNEMKIPADLRVLLDGNESLKAVYNILILKQVDNYFDEQCTPENKLNKLMCIYYRAKNAELKGNYQESKELFASLINENDELFIVKEAKQYFSDNTIA